MNARLLTKLAGLILCGVAFAGATVDFLTADELAQEPLPPAAEDIDVPVRSPRFAPCGTASCATSSCHGGPQGTQYAVSSFSYTSWIDRDKHSRAYEVLFDERSTRMAKLLGLGAPHQERRCLNCHSLQGSCEAPQPEAVLSDGVGCEACHGNASRWEAEHFLPQWKSLTTREKQDRYGFEDLSQPLTRAKKCVECHIGSEGRDVDHELIAAGHPRLMFEYAAYQRLQPIHWDTSGKADSKQDFSARCWIAGQALSVAAAARLVTHRANEDATAERQGDRSRWPELAEFDCYACHHGLQTGTARVALGQGKLGAPRWGTWELAGAQMVLAGNTRTALNDDDRLLLSAIETLSQSSAHSFFAPRREPEMLDAAQQATLGAEAWLRSIAATPRVERNLGHNLLHRLATDDSTVKNWDEAAQFLLALTAFDLSSGAKEPDHPSQKYLQELRQQLRFRSDADSPDAFNVASFRQTVLQWHEQPKPKTHP